jgi:hypothetical protein
MIVINELMNRQYKFDINNFSNNFSNKKKWYIIDTTKMLIQNKKWSHPVRVIITIPVGKTKNEYIIQTIRRNFMAKHVERKNKKTKKTHIAYKLYNKQATDGKNNKRGNNVSP